MEMSKNNFEVELVDDLAVDGNLVYVVSESVVSHNMKALDASGLIAKAIESQNFGASNGEVLHLVNPYSYENIFLVGAKDSKNYKKLGANITKMLIGKKIEVIQLHIADDIDAVNEIVSGMLLRYYQFDKYKKFPEKEQLHFKKLIVKANKINSDELDKIKFEANTIKWARDLINMSPAEIYPQSLAKEMKQKLEPLGVKVTVLTGSQLEGMNLLLGVGQASTKAPHVVVMEYNGFGDNAGKNDTVALVGKGVTYDCGGLSIKVGNHMETMKSDMSGSALVAAVMANAAKSKVRKKVIGIVGLVENMIAGNAMRPDDVLISLAGHSVEVNNTDAEGRLVLADILEYVQKNYDPGTIIDFATLTGAIVVALGHVFAGVFSNDDELFKQIDEAGKKTSEPVWRMPMHSDFDAALSSSIADMKNCANGAAGAGSATAAMFLSRFIHKDRKWAHLDIAGVAFLQYEDFASTVGATGFGVQLIHALLQTL